MPHAFSDEDIVDKLMVRGWQYEWCSSSQLVTILVNRGQVAVSKVQGPYSSLYVAVIRQ